LVGLPLTILLGVALGLLVLDGLTLIELALLATMLAPTDAALGQAVITNPAVPENIRETLNVESGLNDGVCVPILFVFLALATGEAGGGGATSLALRLAVEEIGIGLAVGLGFTWMASLLLRFCAERGWVAGVWLQLPVVAVAAACFAGAQLLGGSGFVACYAGGILAGAMAKTDKHRLLLAAEGTGATLALITWVVFGATVLDYYIDQLTWQAVAYGVLSLTVIRMLPVYLALAGTRLSIADKLFVGWFGPRGLASIVFGVIVLQRDLPNESTIAVVAFCTIVLSVIAHGLTASPLGASLRAARGR
jgi:NhaP-type Na+/H+ or K+/H+ antiporter